MGRDSATFWDKGTEVPLDKLKILPRDSQNSGRDRPGQPKSGTGRRTKRDRAEKEVLKQAAGVCQYTRK